MYNLENLKVDMDKTVIHDDVNPATMRILLKTAEGPSFEQISTWLKENAGFEPVVGTQFGNMAMFRLQEAQMNCNHIPAPMMLEDFDQCHQDDPEVKALIEQHKSQAFVSVTPELDLIASHKLFILLAIAYTECAESAVLILQDNTKLAFSPEKFKSIALPNLADPGFLPMPLLVKVESGSDEQGNWGYTTGLRQFGLRDMEIMGSKESADHIQAFLQDTASYCLSRMIRFKKKNTLQYGEDGRTVTMQKRAGRFNEGEKVMRIELDKIEENV